jgi:hypothetical protein
MVPALLPAFFPAAAMSGHVDYGAHVGGFAAGGTLGLVFNALCLNETRCLIVDLPAWWRVSFVRLPPLLSFW